MYASKMIPIYICTSGVADIPTMLMCTCKMYALAVKNGKSLLVGNARPCHRLQSPCALVKCMPISKKTAIL